MSFINKQGDAAINTKLTTVGRQQLGYGTLTFKTFAVGDSEIDYRSLSTNNLSGEAVQILRPIDNQPDIMFQIPRLPQDVNATYPVSLPYPSDNQIVNSAPERGFFTRPNSTSPYTLHTDAAYMRKALYVTSGMNGGTSLTLSDTSLAVVGDYLLIQWFTPNSVSKTVALGNLAPTAPAAFIWYKVVTVNGTSVTVDRPVPNFGSSGSGNVFVFPGGDSIKGFYGPDSAASYWDPNLLAFNASHNATYTDVSIWNFSIIYDNSLIGATTNILHNSYPTTAMEGLRTYLNTDPNDQPIGVLHYTNYTVENFYGEGFFKDTFTLELPTVMYHAQASNQLGLTLKAGGTKQALTNSGTNFSTPYYNLLDGNLKVVGKVFIDLKIAVITDAEILAALSYYSNRNWTLPTMKSVIANPLLSTNSDTIWVTYHFANTPTTDAFDNSTDISHGYRNAMHCQNLNSVSNIDRNAFDYIEFKFDFNDLRFMEDSSTIAANPGQGFVANRLIVLVQITSGTDTPEHDRWVEIDYTPNLQGYASFQNSAITRNSLSAQNYRLNGSDIRTAIQNSLTGAKPYYSLNYLGTTSNATFGEEVFFLGNVKTDIQATSYQTRFSILLNNGEFSTSRNPTWTPGTPIYVSEVGIYDDKNNLVVIGKLMNPLRKDAYSLRFITADLDF